MKDASSRPWRMGRPDHAPDGRQYNVGDHPPRSHWLNVRVLGGLAAGALLAGCGPSEEGGEAGQRTPSNGGETTADVPATSLADSIRSERARLDATVYAGEAEAQRHEEVFVTLWDELRAGDPFAVLARFPFERLELGTAAPLPGPDHGVPGLRTAAMESPIRSFNRMEFHRMLEALAADGWRIAQTEWHHARFRPAAGDQPAGSTVAFEIHALHRGESHRLIVRGNLEVEWKPGADPEATPVPAVVRAVDARLIGRKGEPAFHERLVFEPRVDAPGRYPRCSPILLRDLDDDGLAEIILGGCNVVLRNRGEFRFEATPFLAHGVTRPAEAGILADFTGDGIDDYVAASLDGGGLLLFAGDADRTRPFPSPPLVCFGGDEFIHLHVLTAGDVDRDGDLDVFAGQWKAPYVDGSMPTPFHDARDGFPDYLLLNDGGGRFTDATASAGLEAKRGRRTFSASLVDMNDDGALDLVVAADFAGIDLHLNTNDPARPGAFRDATQAWIDQPKAFGMSHTLADFDGDGSIDVYLVGMSSTTARRLDALQASRPDHDEYAAMRGPMGYGNRLLLRRGDRLEQPPYADSAARTGWSWGCVSADFDLDGDVDLYVGNGHLSGRSARDYCTHFWRHDLYTGSSQPNAELAAFFNEQLGMKLGREFSWNGFEHNVLLLNEPGHGFLNAAFLLGAAFEFDSRAVAGCDLDGDGRPDLVVVEYRTDSMDQRVHVLANRFGSPDAPRHWIGVRLPPATGRHHREGAVVEIRAGTKTWVRPIVTGDSFTTQHPPEAHFGLGAVDRIDSITVRWPSGAVSRIQAPAIDRYHPAPTPTD